MAVLNIHGLRNDINSLISHEIKMPNMTTILIKEKVKVHAYTTTDEEIAIIKTDPNEPLNKRFQMDPVDQKKPIFLTLENLHESDDSPRCLILNSGIKSSNKVSLNIPFSTEFDYELSGCYEKNFNQNNSYTGNWRTMFTHNINEKDQKFLLPQSNSLILNDSFLFNRVIRGSNMGYHNLINCLKVLLPKECSDEFHILIITALNNWSPSAAKKNFEQILTSIEQDFKYPILFELVIWEPSRSLNHKRILVSNYYIATADYGFDIFNLEDKAIGNNDIIVRRIFHDVKQPGDSPYEQSELRLELLKKTYKSAKEYSRNAPLSQGRIYLSNSEKHEKINRLLGVI